MGNNLVVILGAGFSRPAGLPLANEIKERFDRDQKDKLLRFSSGEWMWIDDKRDTEKHNGKINPDSSVYGYILNEAVSKYKSDVGSFDNYELFYQWIQNIRFDKRIKKDIYLKAKAALLEDNPYFKEFTPEYEGDTNPFLFRFENDTDLSNLADIINYLIADLLSFNKSQFTQSLTEYEPFIKFLKTFDSVDIFTLNHDLLLENLLRYFGLQYSRGFSKENSEIRYQDKDTPIAVFKNAFYKTIRLHKLHGSIDYYRFEHYVQGEKPFLESTGMYNYFTTNNYREKQFAVRVNPKTGEMIQDSNFNIVPKFITGTDKTKIIENDLMYSELFKRFEDTMNTVNKVFISGYSFGDEHINIYLNRRNDLDVINQNPTVQYPFKSKNISHINSLKKLIKQ
jgi:hypothetical protein